jgi:ADP-ribosylglycohydrolase
VAFRRDPDALIRETIALGRIFDRDPSSLAASLMAATAVAASCFAQSGRDLMAGVRQAVTPTLGRLGQERSDRLGHLPGDLEALTGRVGVTDGAEALEMVGGDITDPLQAVEAALLLAAPMNERFHHAVEQAARIGGSTLGAFAGAVIGARVGIKGWPWAFANDTWFAEIGRRLVRGPDDLEGLPIPYAVEQHLMFGPRPGFH